MIVGMILAIVACFVVTGETWAQPRHPHKLQPTTTPWAHDPSIVPCGDTTYVFCTGMGIGQLYSTDMKAWHYGHPVLDTLPNWVYEKLPQATMHVWAPDVIYRKGEWHIFYCCSVFGKNTSVIGHAVNKTLNQESPAYKWEDRGMILQSVPGRDEWNAIDPNIVVDENDVPWMTFGSFWGGIKLVRLKDDLSGVAYPEEWRTLAVRFPKELRMKENAIEAPYIFKHDGWYYLFVSQDYCCQGLNSTYKVVVGRSKSVTGPFVDANEVKMTDGGGTLVAEGDKVKWQAMGHNSIATVKGQDRVAIHAYDIKDGRPILQTPLVEWDKDGWPHLNWDK